MDESRRPVKLSFQVEPLEGRLVLSSVAHGVVAASPMHAERAGFNRFPSPVVVSLTLGSPAPVVTSARIDPRTRVVEIQGFAPAAPMNALPLFAYGQNVTITMNQSADRTHGVNGYGTSARVFSLPGQPIPFIVRLVATDGRFARGLATVNITEPYGGAFGFIGPASFVVRLTPARLH